MDALASRRPQPRGNPFKVYAVANLHSAEEVYRWTVNTAGVEIVSEEINRFRKQFGGQVERQVSPHPMVLGIVGPPGSGKTHLLMFAHAKLERETPLRISLVLRGAALPWSEWYRAIVGPALRRLDLFQLGTELLALQAIEVARALPATAAHAAALKAGPSRVYELLRQGELSSTDVENRFRAQIAAVCPGGSDELLNVMASIQRRDVSRFAAQWLSGGPIEPGDLERLGVTRPIDLVTEAAPAIRALAGICRLLHKSFFLCIDELERLTDRQEANGPNLAVECQTVEWLRRLAEGIADEGGALILAGQPRAWKQPVDALDRLSTSRRAIALTLWDAEFVRRLVETAAPDWESRWAPNAFERVAQVTGGNVRRIQTLLFELFLRTGNDDGALVGDDQIAAAAEQRLRPADQRPDLLEPVVDVAERRGGTVERDAQPLDGLVFDLLVSVAGRPRLVVRRSTAGFDGELARMGVELHQQMERLRRERDLTVTGLLIVQGANNPVLVKELDRYSDLTVVDGERPDAEAEVRAAALRCLVSVPSPSERPKTTVLADYEVGDRVLTIAETSETTKLTQRTKLASMSSSSPYALVDEGLDVGSAKQESRQIERARIMEQFRMTLDEPIDRTKIMISVASVPIMLGMLAAVALFSPIPDLLLGTLSYPIPLSYRIAGAAVIIGVVAIVCMKLAFASLAQATLSRRMAHNLIDELYVRGTGAEELARARTKLERVVFWNVSRNDAFEEIRDEVLGNRPRSPVPAVSSR